MKKSVLIIMVAFFITNCESAGTGDPVPIPNVQINCDTAKCKAVPSNLYEVTITVTLSGCAEDQIGMIPVVSGTANITCISTVGCQGTVNTWRDTNSSTVTTVPSKTYSVCGWIDLDIGVPNANDAFADENLLVTSATITLTDWGATYFFRTKALHHP